MSIDSNAIKTMPPVKAPTIPSNYKEAALYWYAFGFQVIPMGAGKKYPTVGWGPWLDALSEKSISSHWNESPKHELAFVIGDKFIVFDTDSEQATAALERLESEFGISPAMIVSTTVCRQNLLDQSRPNLRETLAHLLGL